jgi:SET family sugar efflux transporter-like MFS transporter
MIFAAQAMAMSNMSLFVLEELGGTEAQVGMIFSLAPVFEMPAMLYLGLVAARVEPGRLIRASVLLAAIYYGAICLARAAWQIYPLQVLSAVIVAITSGVAITFFQDRMPGQFGSATNLYVNSIRIGSVSGYLMFGPVASQFGYRGAFVACSLLSLVAWLGTWLLVKDTERGRHEQGMSSAHVEHARLAVEASVGGAIVDDEELAAGTAHEPLR